jgi:hypothetical protein
MYLFDLDDGEAETFVLAQEQNTDLVIIDEKYGNYLINNHGSARILSKKRLNLRENNKPPLLKLTPYLPLIVKQSQGVHFLRAFLFERRGAGVQGGTGGHHVVE